MYEGYPQLQGKEKNNETFICVTPNYRYFGGLDSDNWQVRLGLVDGAVFEAAWLAVLRAAGSFWLFSKVSTLLLSRP